MIYFAQLPTGAIKIGKADDVDRRLEELEKHYQAPLALLHVMEGDRATETAIHHRFSHLRFTGSEQFRPGPDLMDFIGKPLLVSPNPETIEATEATSKAVRLYLPEDAHWALRKMAAEHKTNMAMMARQIVMEYLTKHAPKGGRK